MIFCRNDVVRTGDGGVEDGRDGWRHASVRVEAWNDVVRTGDGGVEDGRDGRRHASVRVEARSVGGRLGRWEEGGTTSLGQVMGALRMGVTGGVMRRCAWRLDRWVAGYGVGRKEVFNRI
ncbi:hypothetical protein MTR67_001903 [Solanum verrucosum]|uniref:Uncharacterized protein n=1 Tax=Solanum verrucosum TaxID=315347 RepID=A0AAF0PNZ9_SOLVR|nr:hypothetical protein MTR67_001903 [Solanum verrucosum]